MPLKKPLPSSLSTTTPASPKPLTTFSTMSTSSPTLFFRRAIWHMKSKTEIPLCAHFETSWADLLADSALGVFERTSAVSNLDPKARYLAAGRPCATTSSTEPAPITPFKRQIYIARPTNIVASPVENVRSLLSSKYVGEASQRSPTRVFAICSMNAAG